MNPDPTSPSPSPSSPSSPDWLVPPSPSPRANPAKVIPRSDLKTGLFRLLPKRFTRDEWEAVKAMFREHPDRRIKRGTPHPDEPGKFFIQYHRGDRGGEYWGTKEQLAERRKKALESSKASNKVRMQTDPEFRARQLASLAALIEKRSRREDARALIAEDKRKWREKAKAKGYFRDYYAKNSGKLSQAKKRSREKKAALEGRTIKPRAKPDPSKPKKPTVAERRAIAAEKYQARKEAKDAKLAERRAKNQPIP